MSVQSADRHAFLVFSGTNDRAVYALCRSIRRVGETVAVVARSPSDKILASPYSRACVAVRQDDNLSVELVRSAVEETRERTGASRITVLPISEYFNHFLLRNRQELEGIAGLAIPLVERNLYEKLTNKGSSSEFFAAAGIDVPRSLDPDALVPPFVAKPVANVIDGRSLYPHLIESDEDWVSFCRSESPGEYFFQQFVRGRSYYLLAYCASDGSAFVSSQENLAQQPLGKSIVLARTSDFHDSPAATRAIRALQQASFQGIVMIEFIVSDGRPHFIELNPRPWGPLNLCADHRCGIIEAFIGDAAHADPSLYVDRARNLPRAAWYAWCGGAIQSLRAHGRVEHPMTGSLRTFLCFLRALPGDVYLRRDSWRVFMREAFE